jgi:hypothetical protein
MALPATSRVLIIDANGNPAVTVGTQAAVAAAIAAAFVAGTVLQIDMSN